MIRPHARQPRVRRRRSDTPSVRTYARGQTGAADSRATKASEATEVVVRTVLLLLILFSVGYTVGACVTISQMPEPPDFPAARIMHSI